MTTTGRNSDSPTGLLRAAVGDIAIDRVTIDEVVGRFEAAIASRSPCHVATVNLQFLSTAARDQAFLEVVRAADIVVADGMPLVWYTRTAGTPVPERITGHDLLHRCAALAAERGYSVAFLGAEPEVQERAAAALRERYPGIAIKLSVGVDLLTRWRRWEPEALRPYLSFALERFGTHRAMLASNWPVSLLRRAFSYLTDRSN
jgi:UDP-N-acetyl-D-mannosaminuronic acid transferase (WecB/TagA/CpsF family)